MTKDASFKRQVRARMAATGEKYTEARRVLSASNATHRTARPRLFDEITRSDSAPATYGEDSFSFLNRADGIVWHRIRTVLDEWFDQYPIAHASDLRARFHSKLPGQHFAAWWELYLHRFFTQLGYEIEVHPDVPDTSRRPDFLLRREKERLYLEAAVVFSGIVDETRDSVREGWIIDAANRATSPNFMVKVEFEQVGTDRPKDRAIFKPLETWLARLDPDRVEEDHRLSGELPELLIDLADWRIRFEAIPVKPEARGERPAGRLVGIGPVSAGWVDDKEQLRDTLKHKRGRYVTPGVPLVVAINCVGSFPKSEDIGAALYGSIAVQYQVDAPGTSRSVRLRDGTWIDERGPRGQRMSAVLAAVQLHSHTVLTHPPELWHNPWAHVPLEVAWPVTEWRCSESGSVTTETREPDMASLFNLPSQWPGPERPW